MTNQEFNEKLDQSTSVIELIRLRNNVKAPQYIAACKSKLNRHHEGYVLYSIPMSTLKRYTARTGCGESFYFKISDNARGNFKDLRGLTVTGYVIEKQGCRYTNALILLKSIDL